MTTTHERYTDNDLLRMLQMVVSDYNKQPTQREVLADSRLPTHHTYRKRFGTLANALHLAGVGMVPKDGSHLHNTIAGCIDGVGEVKEWVPVGSMVVDFEIAMQNGRTILIDLLDLQDHINADTAHQITRMRLAIADAYRGEREYIAFTNPREAIRHIANLAI